MKKIILLGLLVLSAVFLAACTTSGYSPKENYTKEEQITLDSFAQCLMDEGATMYGASWCSHCKAQKELFGSSFQYVNYVECTENKETCDAAGVKGYPTWIVKGKSYPGEKSFEVLGILTGCEAPNI